MASNLEGRISLALHAYATNQCKSLSAAATLYGVPRKTLFRRNSGIRSRRETRPAACKLTQNEEEVVLQRILDLDEQGFLPQLTIVRDIANIVLSNRGHQLAPTVGKN